MAEDSVSSSQDPGEHIRTDIRENDAAGRHESLGPIGEAAVAVRAYCETLRTLLDELEGGVAFHLELLDAVIRSQHGYRWWQQLERDLTEGDEFS
jgi:hypothetical protein